jgi:hypothetical protein
MKIKFSAHINILICFALLLVFISITKYSDYDLWWHLKLGESVTTSGIYYLDDFSYTFDGKSQYVGEWFADLIIYLFFKVGGFIGIDILKTGILLLAFFFLLMTIKHHDADEKVWIYSAIVTLTLVIFAIRFRLFVRPYIFSILFISLFLFIISLYEKERKRNILFLLPLIEIIWANMSVGATFGPMLFLFFIIGYSLKNKFNPALLIIFLLIIASSLLNPETYGIYSLLLKLSSDPNKGIIGEYQPLSLQILWGYGFRYTFAYQILVMGSLLYFIFMGGWRNIYHLLLFTVFFAESIIQVRMIEFFSLVSALFFIHPVKKLFKIILSPIIGKKYLINSITSFLILCLIPISVFSSNIYDFGFGIKKNIFPEEALAFLDKENIKGRMFNSYGFGGYIIWHSPERKVFFDGRNKRLYNLEFDDAYTQIIENPKAWDAAERSWGFNYAVLEYNSQRSRNFPLHLNHNPSWALVYWDNHSVVYLKRIPSNRRVIDDYEYKITKPNFNDFSYLQQYLHSDKIMNIIDQINREIAFNPLNQEPRLAKAFLLYYAGKPYHDEAIKELNIVVKLKPDISMEHSALAYLLFDKGLIDKAKEETSIALKINPNDPGAKQLVKILGNK